MFSIFTPTHDSRYLNPLYRTLLEQEIKDWEWIILLNGKSIPKIPSKIRDDSRVKIYCATNPLGNIGALKKEAVSHCTQEYIIEVDHDDLLTPNALSILTDHIWLSNKPEFLYSDFVNYMDGYSYCETYKNWDTYQYYYKGKKLIALSAPPVSARNLYQIYFAPNHVRVWRKDFYDSIGGHNEQYSVCDDHELLCRTYLAGANMVHIPNVLYIYRIREDGKNTYLLKNEEIQKKQQEVGNAYFERLIHEEAKRRKLRLLDLGAAHNPKKGYETLDMQGNVDHKENILEGLSFEDNSFMVVRAYDFLEHIPQGLPVIKAMNEIWRILAQGGFLVSATPSTDGKGAWCDPTHVSYWNDLSFRYYCDPNFMKYIPEFKGKFEQVRVWNNPTTIPYVFADLMKLRS